MKLIEKLQVLVKQALLLNNANFTRCRTRTESSRGAYEGFGCRIENIKETGAACISYKSAPLFRTRQGEYKKVLSPERRCQSRVM